MTFAPEHFCQNHRGATKRDIAQRNFFKFPRGDCIFKEKFVLIAKQQNEDIVRFIFFFLILTSFSSAEIINLEQFQTPVKDQKDRNTCAYFAVVALVEASIKSHFSKEFDISEQFQISYGKEYFKEYSNKEHGSTYDILMNFKNQGFFLTEDVAPYKTSYFEKGMPCEKYDPFDEQTPVFCFSHGPIDWTLTPRVQTFGMEIDWLSGLWSPSKSRVQLIEDALRKERPVVLTLKVYAPLWDHEHVTYSQEIDEQCSRGELECYGHAILITGFDSERKLFTFKNSWGESWGNKGYGVMDYDYVLNYSDMPLSVHWNRLIGNIRPKN